MRDIGRERSKRESARSSGGRGATCLNLQKGLQQPRIEHNAPVARNLPLTCMLHTTLPGDRRESNSINAG